MKFAFCLYKFFRYGGLERDFIRIATNCHRRGHLIDVFTANWKGEIPDFLNIILIPINRWSNHGKNRHFVKQLTPLLRAGNYDLIIGFNKMPGLDLYYAADPCYLAHVHRSKPWYYRMTQRYKHFAKFEKAVFAENAHVDLIMISEIEQEHFIQYYQTPIERFHLLAPGINRDRMAPENAAIIRAEWRREFSISDQEKVILMVGSAFKGKGVDRTLLALTAIRPSLRKKTRLIVIGEDDPSPFTRLAKKLGVAEQLQFFRGREDIPRFLLGCDLLLHPAYRENTGTVIVEAVVAGLPVLATEVCGYAFHVTRAKAGIIIPSPFQQKDLNRELEHMLSTPEIDNWRQNGIDYGRQQDLYSLPETVADLIEQIANRHRNE